MFLRPKYIIAIMFSVFKCLCAYLILSSVNISYGIRFAIIVPIEPKHRIAFSEQLALQRADLRTGNIFGTFLKSLLDMLVGVSGKNLVRYCRVLHRHLEHFEFKYTKDLAKQMKYLSRKHREDLEDKVQEYRDELDNKTPAQIDFLDSMNSLFTLQEKVLFDDYVYDVMEYGAERKIDIDAETKRLLKVIVDAVFKVSYRDQKALERKLRKVVKEYKDDH